MSVEVTCIPQGTADAATRATMAKEMGLREINVGKEIGLGLALGTGVAAVWKMYHSSWQAQREDLEESWRVES